MACLNMSNNDQSQAFYNAVTGPRISFSSDFLDSQNPIRSYREAPVSSDFEFSVKNYSMISADEVFSNGRMVPLKENSMKATTLRDELISGDDGYGGGVPKLKVLKSWRERLGLKRSHNVAPKKNEKSIDSLGRIDETKAFEDVLPKFSKGERKKK